MAETSKIEWTDATFNPWIGCAKVHAGCAHCYAEADMDRRRGRVRWGPGGTRSRTSDAYWRQPLKWDRDARAAGVRKRVFCASLADVFEDWRGPVLDHENHRLYLAAEGVCTREPTDVPLTMDHLRCDLFALIDRTPHLDWLLLTKRPENVPAMWKALRPSPGYTFGTGGPWFFRHNVWVGTSVSDQPTADEWLARLRVLRRFCPVLFASAEPLLGPILLPEKPPIDWLIVGGESGAGARPCYVDWVRRLVGQCHAADVPVFVKQLGALPALADCGGRNDYWPGHVEFRLDVRATNVLKLADPKGGDWGEWPADLRCREFPRRRETA